MATGKVGHGLDWRRGAPAGNQSSSMGRRRLPIRLADFTKRAVEHPTATGRMPNRLILGMEVFQRPPKPQRGARSNQVHRRRAIVTVADLLAALFGVDQCAGLGAVKNSALEGQAVTMARIIGKSALLVYATDAPALEGTQRKLHVFSFSEFDMVKDGPGRPRSKRFRMEKHQLPTATRRRCTST